MAFLLLWLSIVFDIFCICKILNLVLLLWQLFSYKCTLIKKIVVSTLKLSGKLSYYQIIVWKSYKFHSFSKLHVSVKLNNILYINHIITQTKNIVVVFRRKKSRKYKISRILDQFKLWKFSFSVVKKYFHLT